MKTEQYVTMTSQPDKAAETTDSSSAVPPMTPAQLLEVLDHMGFETSTEELPEVDLLSTLGLSQIESETR